MGVVFEFQQVVGRVFQKERVVFDARAGEAHPGLLVERQAFRLGPIQQRLPEPLRKKIRPK